jgi:hypothetical protein
MRFGPTAISVASTEERYSPICVTTRIIVSPWHSWPFSAVQMYFVFRQWPQSVAHFHDYKYNFNYALIALNCGLHLRSKWKCLIMWMLVFCCMASVQWFQNSVSVLRGLWNVKRETAVKNYCNHFCGDWCYWRFGCYCYYNYLCLYIYDRPCDLVVRFPGYRSRGPGSTPGATRFSEK